jgi:hypothetical protein
VGQLKFRQPIASAGGEISKIVTVTSAQVLALFTTPVTLVPAPGAGKYLSFERATITKPAGTAYTVGTGGDISVKYTNAAGLAVGGIAPAGFADQATAQTRQVAAYRGSSGGAAPAHITPVANSPLVLHQATANMTAGTSLLKVQVFYRILGTMA